MLDNKLAFIKNKNTKEQLETALNRISISSIREYAETVLEKHGSERQVSISLEIINVLIPYLKARHMYNELSGNKPTDTAIVAVLLHNIFYDRTTLTKDEALKCWKNVFLLREKTQYIADEFAAKDFNCYDAIGYVFQIVEAQMGEDMPVIACRPTSGQITYIVWEVLWFYYTYLYQSKGIVDTKI